MHLFAEYLVLLLQQAANILTVYGGALTALASLGLLWVTRRYTNLTASLVAETKRMRDEQIAPAVVAYLGLSSSGDFSDFELVVENVGGGPARGISVTITGASGIPDDANLERLGCIRTGISFLGPGKARRYLLARLDTYELKWALTVRVDYKDAASRPLSEDFALDPREFYGISLQADPVAGAIKGLQRVAEANRPSPLLHRTYPNTGSAAHGAAKEELLPDAASAEGEAPSTANPPKTRARTRRSNG